MHEDTWATKIRVNEDYDFTELDIHFISQAMAKSSDIIYKLFEPIDFASLFKQSDALKEYKIAGKPITENDLFINTVKKLSTDEKLSILFSLNPKIFKTINYLQEVWDKTVVNID